MLEQPKTRQVRPDFPGITEMAYKQYVEKFNAEKSMAFVNGGKMQLCRPQPFTVYTPRWQHSVAYTYCIC